MTQFNGTMQVEPRTWTERLFAVTVLVLALVVCAGFISTVTSILLQIESLHSSRTGLQQQMHEFLEEKAISTRLVVRLRRFIRTQGVMKIKKQRENIFLDFLPETLLLDVRAETRIPSVVMHHF